MDLLRLLVEIIVLLDFNRTNFSMQKTINNVSKNLTAECLFKTDEVNGQNNHTQVNDL